MSLRTRLRERRQALGLTLQQVGDAVGVSKSTVQKWESGEIEDMRLSKAASLAEVLKVSPLLATILYRTRYSRVKGSDAKSRKKMWYNVRGDKGKY